MSLSREKKKRQLADAMSKAGIGKGIAGAISDETVDKVKKVAADKVESLKRVASKAVSKGNMGEQLDNAEQRFKKLAGREMNPEERKDAWGEIQTGKRYEKVGVSPIYEKGKFSRKTKELEEKFGSRLTEDDKVPSTSKKRGRRQY